MKIENSIPKDLQNELREKYINLRAKLEASKKDHIFKLNFNQSQKNYKKAYLLLLLGWEGEYRYRFNKWQEHSISYQLIFDLN